MTGTITAKRVIVALDSWMVACMRWCSWKPSRVSASSASARRINARYDDMNKRLNPELIDDENPEWTAARCQSRRAVCRAAGIVASQAARAPQGCRHQRAHHHPPVAGGRRAFQVQRRRLADACGCCLERLAQDALPGVITRSAISNEIGHKKPVDRSNSELARRHLLQRRRLFW